MAWTAPMTAVANAVFTAAQFNTHVRDNLLETSPAKATTPGSYFVTDAANSIGERIAGSAVVNTSQGTTSTTYVDLGTVGPAVTASTGTTAIVLFAAEMQHNTSSDACKASVAVSGATTVAASDDWCVRHEDTSTGSEFNRVMGFHRFTGLTAGSNTFTMKYASTAATTANFNFRELTVIPF